MTSSLKKKVEEACAVLRPLLDGKVDVGIILGTGLGRLAADIKVSATRAYEDIPHFPRSTVASHAGRLVIGTLAGKRVIAMEGRFHSYEGYSLEAITLPVRVFKALGARALVVSNACGGLNPSYAAGDLVLIEDHINLMPANPLTGPNDDSLGPRFPDMFEPYSHKLMDLADQAARQAGIVLKRGVYVGVSGPNLETRAEYRYLRTIGADMVGMSTVPEVIVAVHAGLPVCGFSVVTDLCSPEAVKPVRIEEILATAAAAEPRLAAVVKGLVERL